MILSLLETRVLACLIEKSITTPEYYPLTLNALTAACSQKSNRDPLMQVEAADVLRVLDSLREKKLAWSVTLAGSRVPKYRHSFLDVYPLTSSQLAVLCELMLRGAQTAGELRMRASRMAQLADTGQVQTVLHELAEWTGGALARKSPRQVGQREERYVHLLSGEPLGTVGEGEPPPEPARHGVMVENAGPATLESRVAALEDELARLRAQLADFVKQFQ